MSEADSFYAVCETGWIHTFGGTRQYLDHAKTNRICLACALEQVISLQVSA